MLSPIDRTRRAPIDRSHDRLVALAGIALSLAFLVLALTSMTLPASIRHGLWLPLHLVLAGAASTAIAGVLPFFVAAFAAAQPAGAALRGGAVVGVAAGAAGVTLGFMASVAGIAVAGGVAYIAGIGLVGVASVQPLSRGLGPSRGIVTRAYFVALVMVGVGAMLATLFLAGWTPVVDSWDRLKPGHGWLNLVGFVSLIIAATLIHFFPTVVGARIGAHKSGRVALIALALGAPLVAAGYAFGVAVVVQLGATATIVGAVALSLYAVRVWATRGHWTTDPGWHRFVIGGLASAVGWFALGIIILGTRTIAYGSEPAGWSIEPLVGPLVLGWVGLAVLASATHLLPAVGPGDLAAHARQRMILGRLAGSRLLVLNIAVAGISAGIVLGWPILIVGSAIGLSVAFLITVALLTRAVLIGVTGYAQR